MFIERTGTELEAELTVSVTNCSCEVRPRALESLSVHTSEFVHRIFKEGVEITKKILCEKGPFPRTACQKG